MIRVAIFFLGELMRRGVVPTGVDDGGIVLGTTLMAGSAIGDVLRRRR